ncbi:UPF0415 protein C7orf25 homolog [Oratosquilla oratoria]|uniref:UPF0415 protein C7orf25 homolog n=1 Tax=Oratosquilla oratoria TaxID=337810 RepID=UPI003F75FA11
MELATSRLKDGKILLDRISSINHGKIEGLHRLEKKINAEIKFLEKIASGKSRLNEEHVRCSNLSQLEAIVEVLQSLEKVKAVLQPYSYKNNRIIIDIVAEDGKKWVKVVSRNPKALHTLYKCRGRNGVKPMDMVAESLLLLASERPVLYQPPQVVFWFQNGVSESLSQCLQDLGAIVIGQCIEDSKLGPLVVDDESSVDESDCDTSDEDSQSSCERCTEDRDSINSTEIQTVDDNLLSEGKRIINLDVTAMIAYVSATSNGGCNYIFEDEFLAQQAEWERKNPVKPVLEGYFKGCELCCCESAAKHFSEIVETIGGDGEKKRAKELLERLTILPDCNNLEEKLKLSGNIRLLSRLIFGTGYAYKAITVTSNQRFHRAAKQKNIELAVVFHEPRALTEMKEKIPVVKS